MLVSQKDPRVKLKAAQETNYNMSDLEQADSDHELAQNLNTSFPQSEVLNL